MANSTTISATVNAKSGTSFSFTCTTNVACNRWWYKIDNGSWVNFSNIYGTSMIVTDASCTTGVHRIQFCARNASTGEDAYSTNYTLDTTIPIITVQVTNVEADSFTISARSLGASGPNGVTENPCDRWYYRVVPVQPDGHARDYVFFSSVSATSASVDVSGFSVNTEYTVYVKARKTSSGLYQESNGVTVKTLGNSKIKPTTYYPDNLGASGLWMTFEWQVDVTSYVHKLEIINPTDSSVIATFNNLQYNSGTYPRKDVFMSPQQRTAFLNAIPITSKSVNVDARLYTYKNYNSQSGEYGAQIGGYSSATLTLGTTKENSGPILTAEVIDINEDTTALTNDPSFLLLNASTAQCTASVTTRSNATIDYTSINDVRTDTITYQKVTTRSYVFYVVDSRGYDSSVTINPEFIQYTPVTSTVSINRVSPVSGNQVRALISGRYFNMNFGPQGESNSLLIRYKYKESSQPDYGNYITINNTNVTTTQSSYSTVNNYIIGSSFDYTKTYDLRIEVSDQLTNSIVDIVIPKGVPVFDWGDGDFEFHVPITVADGISIDGSGSIENSNGDLVIENSNGDVVITNLVSPTSNSDAATKKYVDDSVTGLATTNYVDSSVSGLIALSGLKTDYDTVTVSLSANGYNSGSITVPSGRTLICPVGYWITGTSNTSTVAYAFYQKSSTEIEIRIRTWASSAHSVDVRIYYLYV